MSKLQNLTIIILTFNEECNIEYALKNVKDFALDIFVLDSYSTDYTVQICKNYGARVFYREFDNYSLQRKYALNQLPIKTEWIFVLDADEYLTDDLKNEIRVLLSSGEITNDAYFVNRRFYWKRQWLKRCFYPTVILRLGRNGLIDCDSRTINEHLICKSGKVGYLRGDLVDSNHKSLSEWIEKHNDYSTREAIELSVPDNNSYRLLGSQYERKRWIRENIWKKLPPMTRPFIYFFYRYFLQRGFLDGKKAFMYHYLDAFYYRALIDLKYLESKWQNEEETKKSTNSSK